MTQTSNLSVSYHRQVLFVLVGLSLVRLVSLIYSPLNLHGDEAQYWAWSQSFEFGYFSKPPMIAWVIGVTTGLFGNAEWAVRLSSPLIHPLTAYLIYRTGRFMFDGRTGFWAACAYFLMPAVWLSSGIVSTDVVLLVWWALGLNAWAHMRETPNMKWAIMLGLAIGLGMLSKYAMLFFIVALALCCVFDAKTRKALVSRNGLIVAAMTLAILAPNLLWNANNDFATVSHTAANANLNTIPFHPMELLEFWASQLGVFGPVTLIVLGMALVAALRTRSDKMVLVLCMFILSPLVIISIEAFLSRANANWAVSAYVGGAILVGHIGVKTFERLTKTGVWVNIGLGCLLMFAGLVPSFGNAIGQANAFKRLRGWPQTVDIIKTVAEAGHEGHAFQAIATDNRLVFYDLFYYGVEDETGLDLRMWLNGLHAVHHAEKTAPLGATQSDDGPVLLVNYFQGCQNVPASEAVICFDEMHARGKLAYIEKFRADFVRIEPLPPLEIDLGGGKIRRLNLWAGYGYTPTHEVDR